MLTNSLRIAIYARAREHGVDRESLHETIWLAHAKKSVNELTDAEARQLLDGLRGNHPPTRRRTSPERRDAMSLNGRRAERSVKEYLVTPQELEMLSRAREKLGWSPEAFDAFLARQCGAAVPRTLTEFNRCWWGLKATMQRHGVWSDR